MKSVIFMCLLLALFAAVTATAGGGDVEFRNPRPYLKRGSLSNMMRIGKRQSYLPLESDDLPLGCDNCNLGTLMRIGRR